MCFVCHFQMNFTCMVPCVRYGRGMCCIPRALSPKSSSRLKRCHEYNSLFARHPVQEHLSQNLEKNLGDSYYGQYFDRAGSLSLI